MEEIADMKAKGQNELNCHYCNKTYKLSDEDFDSLIAELRGAEKAKKELITLT